MSVVGIDLGTSAAVLATIGGGAVKIIRNEISERLTPCLIGYTEKERVMGEAALSQLKSQFKSTCRYPKFVLGRAADDPAVTQVEAQHALCPFVADATGMASYDLKVGGKHRAVNPIEALAALLGKLKSTAENSLQTAVHDVVIGVPVWYGDAQRRAVLAASKIAGLNCMRVMNEHAAVALDYGIFRSSTFHEDKPCKVAFVSMGHGQSFVSIVDFTAKALKVCSVLADPALGGRDMDLAVMKHFSREFKAKHGIDPMEDRKARLKLEDIAAKARKILSANRVTSFAIECLIGDYDMNYVLSRELFEQICEPLQKRFDYLIKTAMGTTTVDFVEVVGGCTRIPWVQNVITEMGVPISRTLMADETVARGCALQAAMKSPRIRVRDFSVVDVCSMVVGTTNPSNTVLFHYNDPLGFTKKMQYHRDRSIEGSLMYVEPEFHSKEIVKFVIDLPEVEQERKVAVLFEVTDDGTVEIRQAHTVEEVVREERVMEKRQIPTPSPPPVSTGETEEAPAPVPEPQFEEVPVIKSTTHTVKTKINIRMTRPLVLTDDVVRGLVAAEKELKDADRLCQETRDALNELEAYILRIKAGLDGELRPYGEPRELSRLAQVFSQAEEWLWANYGESKATFALKMQELKSEIGEVDSRYRKVVEEQQAVEQLAAEQRAAELLAAEQRAAELLAAEQRAAELASAGQPSSEQRVPSPDEDVD